jgi:hypothetical protein
VSALGSPGFQLKFKIQILDDQPAGMFHNYADYSIPEKVPPDADQPGQSPWTRA